MSSTKTTGREPTHDEMESLFVNNKALDSIETHLNRFNPIKIMKMERMEIRHSAILAWLMDPTETHGLGDQFLKAFLAEALRGQRGLDSPTALEISQSDLRDCEVRCEWQNIDIFILSPTNGWAFIIENKFDSKQHGDQLSRYWQKVESVYGNNKALKIRGVFLTLWDEDPDDQKYSPIKYETVCEVLDHLLSRKQHLLSSEVTVFLNHYLDILKDATGMSAEQNEMEKLARQLYRDHKKVLDFVIEHGASTDFAMAARALFGENPEDLGEVTIENDKYVFDRLWNKGVSFLPLSWYQAFGKKDFTWPGCEKWWASFPLIAWIEIFSAGDGTKGKMRIFAEAGSLSDYDFRKELIDAIKGVSRSNGLKRVGFSSKATNEGAKYSRFLKDNSCEIKDIQDPDEIERGMKLLLDRFQDEFQAVGEVLPQFLKYGVAKK